MPVTYKTTRYLHEPGQVGPTEDVFIVSDTYSELANVAGAIEVNVLACDSTTEALEGEAGTIQVNNLSFTVDQSKALTVNDNNAVAFVLDARDADVVIYAARLINPSSPVLNSDFAFRGRIHTDFDGPDLDKWEGDFFDPAPNALREWSGEADTIDLGTMLSETVGEVIERFRFTDDPILDVDGNKVETVAYTDWIAAKVDDRQAYYNHDNGSVVRKAMWAELVMFSDVMQMLFDNLALSGLALTFVPTELDITVAPARFHALRDFEYPEENYRYVHPMFDGIGPLIHGLAPYNKDLMIDTGDPLINNPGFYRLRTGGGLMSHGTMYVSWLLVSPERGADDPNVEFSWRELTVAELLIRIGYSLISTVEFIYTTLSTVDVQLNPRSSKGGVVSYLRDVYNAKIKTSKVTGEAAQGYTGASFRLAKTADTYYRHGRDGIEATTTEGGGVNGGSTISNAPKTGQRYLPLTISPTYCMYIDNTAKESRYGGGASVSNIHKIVGLPMLPHNIIFHEDDGETSGRGWHANEPGSWRSQSLRGPTTAIYIACPGLPRIRYPEYTLPGGPLYNWGELGVSGMDIIAPAYMIAVGRSGATVRRDLLYSIEELVNTVHIADEKYYEGAYSMTVPGLSSGFRNSPTGAESWQAIKPGNKITLDGVEWIVNKVVRKQYETDIDLHRFDKYSKYIPITPVPGTDVLPEPSSGISPIPSVEDEITTNTEKTFYLSPNGVNYSGLVVTSELVEGLATKAEAKSIHYGKVRGVSFTKYDPELSAPTSSLPVVTSGDFNIGETLKTQLGIEPGDKIYLRNLVGTLNWSNVAPDGSDDTEDLVYQIGYILQDGITLRIEPGEYRRFL